MKFRTLLSAAFLVVAPAFFPAMAYGDFGGSGERILAFDSDITIDKDSSLVVKETIKVRAEDNRIKHGIYRDFPTRYRDNHGDRVDVGFEVESVTMDGKPATYDTETPGSDDLETQHIENGVRVKIGNKSTVLSEGEHTFVITYKTTFQLGFFPDGDELYYNVTGNGWIFPIDEASAVVHLPAGAKSTKLDLFTGRAGSTEKNGTIAETSPGTVVAKTNAPLDVEQGLTIAVQWPKGIVSPPGGGAYLWRYFRANVAALIGLIGLVFTSLYLYRSWLKYGKDPEHGTIIPLFEPPDGIQPADARFVSEMDYDNKAFAASVVAMGVKGAVKIEEDPGWFKKTITLTRTGQGEDQMGAAERAAYDQLFLGGDSVELTKENWKRVKAANDAIKNTLRVNHIGKDFVENSGTSGVSFLILILFGGGVWITAHGGLAPFIGGGLLVIGAIIAVIFVRLMKAPTKDGQVLRDRVEGFKMFLDTAEKERWEVLNPPKMTPALFEKYLPFALALGVDHTWSETFEREMRIQYPGNDYAYAPLWYSGRNFSGIGAGSLTNSLSTAMASAIASSSSPPGSSSGFSGGSSGGGGGGGGGGGW